MDPKALFELADAAGKQAARAKTPTPMVLAQAAGPFGKETIPGTEVYVESGTCGFAWVDFPANKPFGRWMVKSGYARKNIGRPGACLWVSDYGQSMERKEAYADAFAKVCRENGEPSAWAGSRMD